MMVKLHVLVSVFAVIFLLSGVEGWWGRRRRRGNPPPTIIHVPTPTNPCAGNLRSGLQNAHVIPPYTSNTNLEHGTSVHFACNRNGPVLYRHVSGHTSRVCFNGKWSGSPLVCRNVDECQEGINRCHDRKYCHDTDGSYRCSCPAGWILQADRHTCEAPGCGPLQGIEHGTVVGATGGTADNNMRVFFQCHRGYKLQGSAFSTCKAGSWDFPAGAPVCRDINECSRPASEHGCSQVCVNTDGSYKCDCNKGFALDGDGKTCNPLCTGANSCLHGECVAPETCNCDAGWSGAACDQAICEPPCVNGRCVYPTVCVCTRGWTGPSCSDGLCWGGCLHGGTCTGPLKCSCPEGFDGDRCEISSCEDLPPPDNGLIDCLTFNKQRTCTIYCQDGHGFAAPIDNPYVCGETGLWSNELSRESVPDCSPVDPIGIIVILETEYEFEGECSRLSAEAKRQIRQRTLQIIQCRVCLPACSCSSVEISAPDDPVCGEIVDDPGPFGKRQATVRSKVSIKYVIEAVGLGNETTAKHCTGACRTAVYAAARKVYEVAQAAKADLVEKPIELTVANVNLQLVKDSVQASKPTSRCANEGEVKIGTRCMKCPKGSFLQGNKCLLCPIGTYQDKISQSSCKNCPTGTTTFAAGSGSRADCVTNCTRGTYSRTGMGPCNKCSLDTFQDKEGQTRCKRCPKGTLTSSAGASDQSQCLSGCTRDECGMGFLCDDCKCINDQNVCDLYPDCEDGSDESNCMKDDGGCGDLGPCRGDILQDPLLCMSDIIMFARIDKIVDDKSGNRTLTVFKVDLYDGRRRVDEDSLIAVETKLYLGTKAVSCGCPVLELDKPYLLTVNRNKAQEEIVSHRSMAVEWNAKVKAQLHKSMSLLDDKRCENLLDSPEEEVPAPSG